MTFYNLPETDVTIEYDKNTKQIVVTNLPDGYKVTHAQGVDPDHSIENTVLIAWDDHTTQYPRNDMHVSDKGVRITTLSEAELRCSS